MIAFKQFATDHPILFGCLVVLIFVVFVFVAGVLAYATPGDAEGEVIAAGTKLIGTLVLLSILWRFGWLRAAGIAHPGGWRPWLLALPSVKSCSLAGSALTFRILRMPHPWP
jgi:hypothetical protein